MRNTIRRAMGRSFAVTAFLLAMPAAWTIAQESKEVKLDARVPTKNEYFIQKDGAIIFRQVKFGDGRAVSQWSYLTKADKRTTAKLGRHKVTGQAYWFYPDARNHPRRAPEHDVKRQAITPDIEPDTSDIDDCDRRIPVDGSVTNGTTSDGRVSAGENQNGQPGKTPAKTEQSLTGIYNSNYGSVRIVQIGNQIEGVVTYKNGNQGQWQGALENGVIKYVWRNDADEGTGELRVLPDGILDGYFIDQNGKQGAWYMKPGDIDVSAEASDSGAGMASNGQAVQQVQRGQQVEPVIRYYVPTQSARKSCKCRRSR